jgi:hypothetical protein
LRRKAYTEFDVAATRVEVDQFLMASGRVTSAKVLKEIKDASLPADVIETVREITQ